MRERGRQAVTGRQQITILAGIDVLHFLELYQDLPDHLDDSSATLDKYLDVVDI